MRFPWKKKQKIEKSSRDFVVIEGQKYFVNRKGEHIPVPHDIATADYGYGIKEDGTEGYIYLGPTKPELPVLE